MADTWMRSDVDTFDDETLEIKVFPPGELTSRLVLDRSRYRPLDAVAFPGEFRDLSPPVPVSKTLAVGHEPNGPLDLPSQVPLSNDEAAVLSALAAHPGRIFAPSELAAAACPHASNAILELAQTVARLQEWLKPGADTLEAVETGEGLGYRLLVPHAGPGTESPN